MTFLYRLLLFPYRRFRLLCRIISIKKRGIQELSAFLSTLDELEIKAWADYGTLLGLFRDGKLLKNDADLDVGILFDPQFNFLRHLIDLDYRCICIGRGLETGKYFKLKFERHGVVLDVSIYHQQSKYSKNPETLFSALEVSRGDWATRKIKLQGIKRIEYGGFTFSVPEKPGEYLAQHYGKSFLIPNPKWKDSNSADLIGKCEVVELVEGHSLSVPEWTVELGK